MVKSFKLYYIKMEKIDKKIRVFIKDFVDNYVLLVDSNRFFCSLLAIIDL